jgi:hypothetical protein
VQSATVQTADILKWGVHGALRGLGLRVGRAEPATQIPSVDDWRDASAGVMAGTEPPFY